MIILEAISARHNIIKKNIWFVKFSLVTQVILIS